MFVQKHGNDGRLQRKELFVGLVTWEISEKYVHFSYYI